MNTVQDLLNNTSCVDQLMEGVRQDVCYIHQAEPVSGVMSRGSRSLLNHRTCHVTDCDSCSPRDA